MSSFLNSPASIVPMTLGNMRVLGVRDLVMHCLNPKCLHQERLDVDGYGDVVEVPRFGPRMVCTKCGTIGLDARPNWKEQPPRPSLTGRQWR